MKHTKWFLLFGILILAAFLRFNQLGTNPPSLDWDEASLGYNAYSLLKTGKDEFGRPWPISIRSFEDYKPAVYTYLTIPSVYFFGLTEFAVRFPSALMGTITILVTYFLAFELFKKIQEIGNWKLKIENLSLLTTMLLAISPWHLQFSRVAFESNISLFFVFTGLLLFLKGLEKGWYFVLSAICLSVSFYAYHAPRLVVPLIIIGWSLYFYRQLWQQKKYIIIGALVGILMLIPFIQESFGVGRARLSSVTVLAAQGRLEETIKRTEYDISQRNPLAKILHNRRIVYAFAVAKGYLDHFNINFLFLTGDAPDRHHARDMGMLYVWEAPFLLLGILQFLKTKKSFPIFWWFLMSPAASSITTGTPHAVRALLYLPTYQLFTALGFLYVYKRLKEIRRPFFNVGIAVIVLFLLIGTNVYYYLEMYYVHTPIEASKDWQYGYKQAVAIAHDWEPTVNKIIMTYRYDQPHIFVLFYEKIDPVWYQSLWVEKEVLRSNRQFGKYEFRNIDWAKDQELTNVLLIGTPEEIPSEATGRIAEISFLDGTIAFRVVKR